MWKIFINFHKFSKFFTHHVPMHRIFNKKDKLTVRVPKTNRDLLALENYERNNFQLFLELFVLSIILVGQYSNFLQTFQFLSKRRGSQTLISFSEDFGITFCWIQHPKFFTFWTFNTLHMGSNGFNQT